MFCSGVSLWNSRKVSYGRRILKLPELKIGDLVAKIPIIQGGMAVKISTGLLAGTVAAAGGYRRYRRFRNGPYGIKARDKEGQGDRQGRACGDKYNVRRKGIPWRRQHGNKRKDQFYHDRRRFLQGHLQDRKRIQHPDPSDRFLRKARKDRRQDAALPR